MSEIESSRIYLPSGLYAECLERANQMEAKNPGGSFRHATEPSNLSKVNKIDGAETAIHILMMGRSQVIMSFISFAVAMYLAYRFHWAYIFISIISVSSFSRGNQNIRAGSLMVAAFLLALETMNISSESS